MLSWGHHLADIGCSLSRTDCEAVTEGQFLFGVVVRNMMGVGGTSQYLSKWRKCKQVWQEESISPFFLLYIFSWEQAPSITPSENLAPRNCRAWADDHRISGCGKACRGCLVFYFWLVVLHVGGHWSQYTFKTFSLPFNDWGRNPQQCR